jgi:hypothetical protein
VFPEYSVKPFKLPKYHLQIPKPFLKLHSKLYKLLSGTSLKPLDSTSRTSLILIDLISILASKNLRLVFITPNTKQETLALLSVINELVHTIIGIAVGICITVISYIYRFIVAISTTT